jgi:hypothetical protein
MDDNQDGVISYKEFCLLSEDNWRQLDPMEQYLSNLKSSDRSGSKDVSTPIDSRKSQLQKMDLESLEKLAVKTQKKKLVFNERSFNEDVNLLS